MANEIGTVLLAVAMFAIVVGINWLDRGRL